MGKTASMRELLARRESKEGMMRGRTLWAMGIVLAVVHCAFGQVGDSPEKIGPPKITAPTDGPVLPMDVARSPARFYVGADYLLWWVNHGPSPVLLTTAPNNGNGNGALTGGKLDDPTTIVLFTGRDIDYRGFSGLRAWIGFEASPDGFWSLEAGGFYLSPRSVNYSAAGNADGSPLLTTPFLDAATGRQSSLDINSQDNLGNPYIIGSIAIHSDIKVWGYEANAIAHSIRTSERSVDLLFGYRHLRMIENLTINQVVTAAQDGNFTIQSPTVGQGQNSYFDAIAGSPVFISDYFGTRNSFHGGQAGARFSWDFGQLTAELAGKVAFGVTHQQVTINGSTTTPAATDLKIPKIVGPLNTSGGVFTTVSNIGSYSQNQFTVVPEINFSLKYAVARWMNVQLGYTGLYWSNVVRPGAQIDSTINTKLVPTGAFLPTLQVPDGSFRSDREQARPVFNFRDTAFWAHGINIGVEFRY